MHILLIHQAFVAPTEAGGTRHYEFARACVEQGHQFTIIASNISYLSGQPTTNRTGLVTKEDMEGIKILKAYTLPALHRSFVWRIISFLSFMITSIIGGMRAGSIDIVVGTSPPIFQALSAWIVSALRRRPFLLEIRDLWPDFAIDIGILKNPILIMLSRWLETFLYARATHILVNSPAYRTKLIEKGIRDDKITLIPNGVDSSMFDPQAKGVEFRTRWKLEDKFVVVYTGALGLANDIPTILQGASQLRDEVDIHFVLVGDGKERSHIESLIQELNLTNITVAGSYPKSEIPRILAAADVGVATLKNIPMFRTTYPNKVFDYMAAGRPTILAIDGVIRELVETSGGGIFVPPGDANSLAETVRGLSKQPNRVREMGNAARIYVVKYFDRRKHATQFIELVKQMVA